MQLKQTHHIEDALFGALPSLLAGEAPNVLRDACGLRVDDTWVAQLTGDGSTHVDIIRTGTAHAHDAPSPSLVAQAAAEGSSLRIRRSHTLDDTLRDLAFEVHRLLCEEININVYWSPTGDAAGLAPHRDGYDIVVVQVAGRKTWSLGQEFREQLVLGVGDALFLPAGWPHQAHNAYDESSTHLSIGVYAKTQRSVIEWLATALDVDGGSTIDDLPATLHSLSKAAAAVLTGEGAATAFAAHRQVVEYERMLMNPIEHAQSSARKYR